MLILFMFRLIILITPYFLLSIVTSIFGCVIEGEIIKTTYKVLYVLPISTIILRFEIEI